MDYVILTLVLSSIFAGVSMACSLIESIINLMYIVSFIISGFQTIYVVEFSEKKVDVIGGHLTITFIGILAMSMGIMLSVIKSPYNVINTSVIAGPIIGSGLTLIAIGLQRYYEEREYRRRRFRRRPRLY